MTFTELTRDIMLSLMARSGVLGIDDANQRASIAAAALDLAHLIYDGAPESSMATSKLLIPEIDGTPKQIVWYKASTFSSPSPDLRITSDGTKESPFEIDLTSLSSGSCRQANKCDFGSVRADRYILKGAFELAATPTAGNTILAYMAWSDLATAGSGNVGNTTGADGAYTGYSANADASLLHLDLIGVFTVTTQATATMQAILSPRSFVPKARYGNLVIRNGAGSSFHTGVTKTHIVATPYYLQGQSS